jgi:hypothetical protein
MTMAMMMMQIIEELHMALPPPVSRSRYRIQFPQLVNEPSPCSRDVVLGQTRRMHQVQSKAAQEGHGVRVSAGNHGAIL